MKLRDIAVVVILLSAAESYTLIYFAPHLRPLGGLGRLVERFFLLNIACYAVYKVFIYPFFFSPLRRLPGPYGGLFGNAVEASFSHPRGDRIRQWSENIPNNGIIRFRKWFNKDALVLTSHETLRACLNDHSYDYEKEPRVRDILKTVLGEGLILVEGNVHKFQRKHLLPSFQVKVIRDLYPTFWQKACQLTSLLSTSTTEPEVELGVWCTRATLDIIGIAGFGHDFNSLVNPSDDFVRQYNDVLEPNGEKAVFFALNLIFPYWLINLIPFWQIPRRLTTISHNLYSFAYNLSKSRRAELNDPNTKHLDGSSHRNDILSLLIKSNDFTDHELAHQVLTMMAAGHETTSSTLSWCLYLLALNPEYQSLLRDEIRASLPPPPPPSSPSSSKSNSNSNSIPDPSSSTPTITASQIDSLPYLNSICNETLRLYPTVPVTTRISVAPTPLAGMTIPSGTSIFIAPWAINRSTKLWGPNALDFVPERWLDVGEKEDGTRKVTLNNSGGASSNYDIMTFLHGPRSCIGQGFARSELKCLLAALVGRYEFATTRDLSTYYTAGLVTTKPANGMWMKVTEVPGW